MDIRCNFNDQSRWRFIGQNIKVYVCYIKEDEITKHAAEIKSFVGAHLEERKNEDVDAVCFSSVHYIPRGIMNSFTNMQYLELTNCGLKEISHHDLKEMPQLKELALDNNKLRKLPRNLFIHTPHLEQILFRNNRIVTIGTDILEPLKELKVANFLNNITINLSLSVFKEETNCTLAELKNHINFYCKAKLESDSRSILEDLQKVMFKDALLDFKIIIADREFKVHKFMMVARSETFCEMIENNPEADEIVLTNIEPEIFEIVLKFIYEDFLPDDAEKMLKIYAAATKLEIQKLRDYVESELLKNINEDNAYEVLVMSNNYESNELRTQAFAEIRRIFKEKRLKDDLAYKPEAIAKLFKLKKYYEDELQSITESINDI